MNCISLKTVRIIRHTDRIFAVRPIGYKPVVHFDYSMNGDISMHFQKMRLITEQNLYYKCAVINRYEIWHGNI